MLNTLIDEKISETSSCEIVNARKVTPTSKQISAVLPIELIAKLKYHCTVNGLSQSEVLEKALNQYLLENQN